MAEESLPGQEEQLQPGQMESVSGLLAGLQGAELRIKSSICKSVQSKVESILHDVEKFSDIEKLYLYLKLPSYSSSNADKSDQSALSSSRVQQVHAFNWIRNHLEEYPETSLPKQEVYDEYKSFCDNLNYHPLSAADFGKMMKNVFPNMKARRLGMRGKSKYCYSGLRKRPFIHMPSLPTLDIHKTDMSQCDVLESPGQLSGIKEDVRLAACDLVCEWAQKVLKRQFDAVEDLARFLIDSHYISNKSLAALTIMTGTATEVKASQAVSAFVPSTESHSFQPHASTLSSPSVDAKQQLQRKIQRKQQEQKLQSPLPGEGQTKRSDDNVPCETPTPPLPQPAIGIMVTAVPSPITVQRNSNLMSSSPVGTLESKLLPINFQMVTHTVKSVKPNLKSSQNALPTTIGERVARQRYAQILPKPSATTAIALRSPSTMIISNSTVKTVMTTCHVSPVSLVKISLAPSGNETTTSLTNTTKCQMSVGGGPAATVDISSHHTKRSTSAAPILTPVARLANNTSFQSTDVDVVDKESVENIEMQSPSCRSFTPPANSSKGAVQRAASVPIPQTKGFLCLEETSSTACNRKAFLSINTVTTGGSSNHSASNRSTPSSRCSTMSSLLSTSRPSSFDESSQAREGNLSRKRSGLSPDLVPPKRVFIPQQPVDGSASFGYEPRPGTSARPESAPATREIEMKINMSTQGQTVCTSSFRPSGFYSIAKTLSSMQRKNTPAAVETGTFASQPLAQQEHGYTVANASDMPNNPGFQKYSGMTSNPVKRSMEGAQQQTYTESDPAAENIAFLNQTSTQLPVQSDMDYFHFDDDVTQDSIMEELVQMEEQMKLNKLQAMRGCTMMQGHQTAILDSLTSNNQTINAFYNTANNNGNTIQTSTPTPTPTSEMMGGPHSLSGESPCSNMASTTPVDSALGSSRHTSAGTPHSNCSSAVPPSPVECRNPFAFTPINSNITGFQDGSPVSSSPVKPMQRPMATHPDKTKLEWMNNSYNSSSSGSVNKSNNGMGILPSYQGYQFQKPHAFAIPHARHHDSHLARLTPISPVQQQVASLANMTRQEGFAVPAPLDNKTTNTSAATFRCRSVSPAVHQRNLNVNPINSSLPNVPRSRVSPFNPLVMPEELNIFTNSQTNLGVSSMAQRSRSVPLNIMMQTQVLPTPGQQCSSKNITNVLLSKLDGDHNDSVRGVIPNRSPSTYTARMNLTQILESSPGPSCTDGNLDLMTADSTSTCKLQSPNYLIENAFNDPMSLSAGGSQVQSASGGQSAMLALCSQQEELQQQLDFSGGQELLTGNGLSIGTQLIEQVSELSTGGADFPCEVRMTSELSSSINDLNTLDTNLLFDPNLQQGQYQNVVPEDLVSNSLFQQITSEAAHATELDWLESKDHPAVGLIG